MKYIYKLTSPSGKIYIGQSANLKQRKEDYRCKKAPHQPKLRNSFLKYGVDNHNFEILYQGDCSNQCLDRLERSYILMYNSVAEGLNCTEGGGGRRGYKHSEETKQKISETKKASDINHWVGRKHSEETRLKMSEKAKMRYMQKKVTEK